MNAAAKGVSEMCVMCEKSSLPCVVGIRHRHGFKLEAHAA